MVEAIDTTSLRMAWSGAPWDEAVCGFAVLQISRLEVRGPAAADDLKVFEHERDRRDAGLVSCRLPHERLAESMLLEAHGFRFIEMVYQPEIDLSKLDFEDQGALLSVAQAGDGDLPAVSEIARTAFHNERFRMDPRLDPGISDRRYQNWAIASHAHPAQELYVIRDGQRTVAFFVTELLDGQTCYWHLNAVAPDVQGQGYGRRVWLSMLQQASKSGASRVRTSIAARNHRVLNLYARLGFVFPPPTMTFHWVR